MARIPERQDPAKLGFDASRLARLDAHFQRYVDDGRLAGWSLLIARHGEVAHLACHGQRDREAGLPVTDDTLFRIYSMTKPITSVAAMMLWEQGAFELTDPIAAFIPDFAEPRVYAGGPGSKPVTVPATEPIRVWHLLTHTAGLTYGFHHVHPVDAAYRAAGFEWDMPADLDLAGVCAAWAAQPLLFEPGREWNYSVATDVLGRLVEVVSGQRLDAFFAEHIFAPLGMTDTGFHVRPADVDRLAALYVRSPQDGSRLRYDALGDHALRAPRAHSGGGGLVSSIGDYHRFTELLRRGGELDGVRLLAPSTLAMMTRNQLPGNADLQTFGRPLYAETRFEGVGFGLGFAVVMNPDAGHAAGSVGEFNWGGAASTNFWVDRARDVTAIFLTQLLPSSTYPLRPQLRQLTYQALTDEEI